MSEIPSIGGMATLQGGEVHARGFDLEAGQFLRVLVDQKGIDVFLRLSKPDAGELLVVDSPNGNEGYEELVFLAEASGSYLFDVVGTEAAAPGQYRLEALEQRPATEDDRAYVAADRADETARGRFKERDYEAAAEHYRRALKTWSRLGAVRREIDTLHGLGRVLAAQGKLVEATAFYTAALELYRGREDRRGMDVLLDRTGWTRLRRGQPERAVPLCEEALGLFEARGFDLGAALALSHLGTAYHNLGQSQRALDAFDRALVLHARTGDARSEASIRNDLANLLLDLHRPQEALEHSRRAVEIHRKDGDPRRLAIALEGLALAAVRLGNLPEAEKAIGEALELPGDGGTVSTLYSTEGFILQRRGDAEAARASYEKALGIARKTGDRHAEAWVLARIGFLDAESGLSQAALDRYGKASEIFSEVGERRGLAVVGLRGGEALRDQGKLKEAWERMAPALDFIEETRWTTVRSDVRTGYFAYRQDYYESVLDVLWRLHDQEGGKGYDRTAFAVNERRLARELEDRLAERRSLARAGVVPALLEEERRLERELSEASLERDEERIAKLSEALEQAGAGIRRAVFDGTTPEPLPADVEALCGEVLDEETLLLVYALGERRSLLWSVSAEGFALYALPSRSEIERLAVSFAGKLARSDLRSQTSGRQDGRRLSDLLLAPVAVQIAAHKRLALVLEGDLQAVPFAALPEPGGDDDAFLVRRYETVVLPSVTALRTLRRARAERPPATRRLALFADPVFRGDDPRIAKSESEEEVDALRSSRETEIPNGDLNEKEDLAPYVRLPHTRREVERIREVYEGDTYLGFAASRETFLGPETGRYSGLHVASHAVVDPERPALSGLVFSLVDRQGRRQNGFVRAFEISRLDLSADLVVLSACRTGRGRDLRGEGVQALSRAFLDAGVPRVVLTLWSISDRYTAKLMSDLYEGLAAQKTPSAALREAQASMLAEPGATSGQWAGFILVGDWRELGDGGRE